MIKVWIFENSYYIGNDIGVTKNAIRSEEIIIPEGKELMVVGGKVSFVDAEEDII